MLVRLGHFGNGIFIAELDINKTEFTPIDWPECKARVHIRPLFRRHKISCEKCRHLTESIETDRTEKYSFRFVERRQKNR